MQFNKTRTRPDRQAVGKPRNRATPRGPGSSVRLRFGLALALIAAFGGRVLAQTSDPLYDLLKSAEEQLNEAIQEATGGEYELAYELVPPDEFDQAFNDFQSALQTGDLEHLARWLPDATELLAQLDAIPGMEPYADWLRQRLDYAAVADEAVRTLPPAAPAPKPAPTPAPAPAPATAPPAPSKPLEAKPVTRGTYARNSETWSRRIAGRPVPERAARLVPPLKKIFADQGVPAELVWMAEVESTFNPAARSPAGAVGLFQLMPTTAESLGLKVKPKDQRLDPARNGEAAASYLASLHQRFGDWPLAIAAYNGGEGRVSKLLREQGARDLEGIAGKLPAETQMYVPKVLATIRLREGTEPKFLL